MSEYDVVKKPKHYELFNGSMQVLELIVDRVKALHEATHYTTVAVNSNASIYYYYGNVIKYTMRWFHKDGVQDLKKARQYLDYMIDSIEANGLDR